MGREYNTSQLARLIATCVVTQQAQRRHSADINEREHRPQRLVKVCHQQLKHSHQRARRVPGPIT
eukprot:17487-Prymnesium_polylepis.1